MTVRRSLPAALVLFALLATANSGGYRYGVSDHAFYVPAIAARANPGLFPRDTALLAVQSRVWLGDDLIGGLARMTTRDLPVLFAALYGVTMVVLFAAGVIFMRSLGGSAWATAAFLLLLTLRHQIARTGANTLEGYMHPRILAFALGLLALAAVLRRRLGIAALMVALGAALHTTTAFWFALVGAVAFMVLTWRTGRRVGIGIVLAAVVLAVIAAWAVARGPLAGGLATMDAEWLSVIDSRDYLFPAEWPVYAWVLNLFYPLALWLLFRERRRLGLSTDGERAMVAGLLGLVIVFLISVPLTALGVALAVQMQVNRVFWLLDVVVAGYLAWWLLDRVTPRAGPALRPIAVGLLLALSSARGVYILAFGVQRPLLELRPHGEWMETMQWLREQPADWHVLADPQHAWKYGVSVRVAALRDTVLELSKDTAIAMYDRGIAMRVFDRVVTLRGFEQLTGDRARALDARYDIDVLVLEQPSALAFPVLYRNARFVVYDLR